MATKLKLVPRLKQGQRTSTQLHQAINLLTLNHIELNDHILELIEQNPLLERDDDDSEAGNVEVSPASEEFADRTYDPHDSEIDNSDGISSPLYDTDSESDYSEITTLEQVTDSGIDPSTEVDSDVEWDELPLEVNSSTTSMRSDDYQVEPVYPETLADHLEFQIQMQHWDEDEKQTVRLILDEIDDNGYLPVSSPELAAALAKDTAEIDAFIARIHTFSPAGIGARTIQESLLIQLAQMSNEVDLRELAARVVHELFHHVVEHEWSEIQAKYRLSDLEIQEITGLILSLNPRPAAEFKPVAVRYISPDVVVKRQGPKWHVELTDTSFARLRISPYYDYYLQQARGSRDKTFIRQQHYEAKLLVDGIQYREATILQVAKAIVAHQHEFLEEGEARMKPLVMARIAEELNIHPSTVSRATSGKYMATPRGVYELKYFFTSKLTTRFGGEVSSVAIQAMLQGIVNDEDSTTPLSDQKIKELFGERQIRVARRTIAKYRDQLNIPSSNRRRNRSNEKNAST